MVKSISHFDNFTKWTFFVVNKSVVLICFIYYTFPLFIRHAATTKHTIASTRDTRTTTFWRKVQTLAQNNFKRQQFY